MTNSVNSYPVSSREPFATGEAIIQELSSFPKSKALIDEVNKELQKSGLPNVEICIEKTESGFEGEQVRNRIGINAGLSAPSQLSTAVFELHNVLTNRKFKEVWKAALNGSYKSAEEFAKAAERTEFEGKISRMNQISREINQLKGCKSYRPYIENSLEQFPDNMKFEQWYKLVPDAHKEYFRKQWRRVNPDSRNCYSSKIMYAAVTCAAIAISVLGLSIMSPFSFLSQ
jgi:hypothetical protein